MPEQSIQVSHYKNNSEYANSILSSHSEEQTEDEVSYTIFNIPAHDTGTPIMPLWTMFNE